MQPSPFTSTSLVIEMLTIALLSIPRGSDVILVAFTFQDVNGVSIDYSANSISKAPPTKHNRISDSLFLLTVFLGYSLIFGILLDIFLLEEDTISIASSTPSG